jgi:hypothetical protein
VPERAGYLFQIETALIMKSVRIDNPGPFGNRFTSSNSAARQVSRGRAKWSGPRSIRFIEENPAVISAKQKAVQSALGYDQRGRLEVREIRRIPVVRISELLTLA